MIPIEENCDEHRVMMALANYPNGLTSEELDDLLGLKTERVDALIDTLGGHNMSQAEIDAGKWLRAAVKFSDVLGGEGDTCGDAAVHEPLYLTALIEFQLGEPPASTPTEMFPHLLRLATSLFFNAIDADPSCQNERAEERGQQVLDRVLPPPPVRRQHRWFNEDRWPGEGIEGPPSATKENTA